MPIPSAYGAPGVYVEWLDANAQQLVVGRTDVAGFLGMAERGPMHSARKVESMRQFVSTFGAHIERSYLAYAVEGFFANGGRTCWVVRIADPGAARRSRVRLTAGGKPFVLEASSEGAWGDRVEVEAHWGRDRIESLVISEEGRPPQEIVIGASGLPQPVVGEKTPGGLHETDLPELVTEPLVVVADVDDEAMELTALSATLPTARLGGGDDGLAGLRRIHFTGDPDAQSTDAALGMAALARVDGVSFVAAPDLLAAFDGTAIDDVRLSLVASCMASRDRMMLIDMPQVAQSAALETVRTMPHQSYAAVYYPWIVVNDPLRLSGIVRAIPPSGHVAGMFARCDRLRGVHKPPANEVLEGVWDLTEEIDDAAHARLNDASINAIRAIPGRDIRVLGVRTLCPTSSWRYVNVRRLFAMIEEALDEQMQWLVFEPNNPRLWRDIDRAVRGFLERMYRAGMLDGATSEDAYFVHCDGTTNPPSSSDEGRVVCEIGLQPPFPAEFVIVRVGVTRSGIEIDEKGAQDA